MNYTAEEREAALRTSLTDIASRLGYTPVRKGRYYTLKEHDSIMITNDSTWCRWSRVSAGYTTGRGGTQIDFMMEFGNCSNVPEAVHAIIEMNNIHILREADRTITPKVERGAMVLPEKNDNFRRIYAYLCKTRMIAYDIVDLFVKQELIYESKDHHNLVFLGKDASGNVKYAGMRGTLPDSSFKCDVPGNDKSYGVNIVVPGSDTVRVFESVIDCMSWMDMANDTHTNKLILGMLSDGPLETFLQEHKDIKRIEFFLDNDEPARIAVLGNIEQTEGNDTDKKEKQNPGLLKKWSERGYEVADCAAIKGYGKDFNENLKALKTAYVNKKIPGYRLGTVTTDENTGRIVQKQNIVKGRAM